MGAPREYFLDILECSKTAEIQPTEEDVLEMIARGVTKGAPTVGAVKLMVNYAPRIDAFIRNGETTSQVKAIQNIIDWARSRFERVNLEALVRANTLDQAISRAVANETRIWHRREKTLSGRDPHAESSLNTRSLNLGILNAIPSVISNTEVIRRIARANRDSCLMLNYEDLATSPDKTSRSLVEHARRAGFKPNERTVRRELQKLIDPEKSQRIRGDFKAFLEHKLDLW